MRFFNLDLHIGVIGDIKQIFRSLGHEVTDWTISGHSWVLGRSMDPVDVIRADNWKTIDSAMCDAFYARYKSELDAYDGFIVTHTPCFSMLYEKWQKPIICVASTRYEQPFSAARAAWDYFNAFLRTSIDNGMLIPIANNKYDAAYAELFTERAWQVIPSICAYTDAPYTGTHTKSLLFTKFTQVPAIPGLMRKDHAFHEGLLSRIARKFGDQQLRRGYSWKDIAAFRSVVVIPYNASIMSIFEMYTSSIPMLFPSLPLLAELYRSHHAHGILSELSMNQVMGMAPGSRIPCGSMDPNNYADTDVMMKWMAKADYYDPENMAGLVYFDSFRKLHNLLEDIDVTEIHRVMADHHVVRKQRVLSAWKNVLRTVASRI